MARTEVHASAVLALDRGLIEKMHTALVDRPDWWVRLIASGDVTTDESAGTHLIAYLQGPDGEEEKIFDLD